MKLSQEDLQHIVDTVGGVFAKRQQELDLADPDISNADGDHASPELVEAQAETTKALNGLKLLIATKIKEAGYTIVQEGDALPDDGTGVTMPAAIGCDC